MIFTFFFTIVVLAELIIFLSIFSWLWKFDKKIIEISETLELIKPAIKDICILTFNISGQLREFAERFVRKIKNATNNLCFNKIINLIITHYMLSKFKRFKRHKKLALSLLQIVI
jgi:hypothetical protein